MQQSERTSILQIGAVAMAAAALALACGAGVLRMHRDDVAGPKALSAEEAANSGNPTVTLGEMFIEGDLTIAAGATLTVINSGVAPHNLAVEGGPKTADLNGGQATELDVSSLAPGEYTVYCTIEGHRAAGMEATLVIGPAEESTPTS